MRKLLQYIIGLGGTAAIAIALLHLAIGPACIPGSIPVNATMDSEDRFYATIFLGYGLALLWSIKDIERKSQIVYFLAAVFFFGGIARIISMIAVGLPHPFFIAMTVIELTLPPSIVFMQFKLSKASSTQ